MEYVKFNTELAKEESMDIIRNNKIRLADLYRKMIRQNERKAGGLRVIFLHEIFNHLEDYMFEDEDEFVAKWKGYFKQYLGLKAKRWKLNDNKPTDAHQDSLVCKICEKKFKIEKLPIHSKDCLDHAKEIENFNNNQKQILKLSETAVDMRQDITVKASIKR